MKLFVVNRYGAEEGTSEDSSKTIQQKRLKDLLKKAKKRQESALQNISKTDQADEIEIKKKVKTQVEADVPNEEPSAAPADEHSDQKEDTIQKPKFDPNQQVEGFTIIGKDQFKKVKEVKGVLPKWLAQPTVISVDMKRLNSNVDNLPGLSTFLKQSLKNNGVENVFPVQREVVPWILKEYKNGLTGYWPRDACVSAPTGSGKTLAFALPLVQILMEQSYVEIQALVVLPVQDLAKQVFAVFEKYCKGTNVKVALITGQGLLDDEQKSLITKDTCGNFHPLVHIVVTTPGRLVNHLRDTAGLDFSSLRFLIIDEADRVMDSAQSDWLHHLEKHIAKSKTGSSLKPIMGQVPPLTINSLKNQKPPPQKLLFSATLTQDPEKLARLALFQPKLFTCVVKPRKKTDAGKEEFETEFVGQFSMPAEIKERYMLCEDEGAKPLLLHCLLTQKAKHSTASKAQRCKTLCFTSSKVSAHRLRLLLEKLSETSEIKLKVAEITSELRLQQRNAILERFSCGKIDVIVSTDAMARGIDLPIVDCVISYDVPEQSKLYVHRVGRTGRAGRKGEAITVLLPQQLPAFQHILRGISKTSLKELESPTEDMEALLDEYKTALEFVKKAIKSKNVQLLKRKKKKTGVFVQRGTSFLKRKTIGNLKKGGKRQLTKKTK